MFSALQHLHRNEACFVACRFGLKEYMLNNEPFATAKHRKSNNHPIYSFFKNIGRCEVDLQKFQNEIKMNMQCQKHFFSIAAIYLYFCAKTNNVDLILEFNLLQHILCKIMVINASICRDKAKSFVARV